MHISKAQARVLNIRWEYLPFLFVRRRELDERQDLDTVVEELVVTVKAIDVPLGSELVALPGVFDLLLMRSARPILELRGINEVAHSIEGVQGHLIGVLGLAVHEAP